MKLMNRNKADGLDPRQFPGYDIVSECCKMLPLGEATWRGRLVSLYYSLQLHVNTKLSENKGFLNH